MLLSAIAAGYAASVRGDDASPLVLGFMIILLPIVFAVTLWWIVSEKLAYAAWWATANLLAPLGATMVAAGAGSSDKAAGASQGSKLSDAMSVLSDFFLPMILMSVATGVLLVWLMRRSEIRRR